MIKNRKDHSVIFAATLCIGWIFAVSNQSDQRAVDGALALLGQVKYPPQSVMSEYFLGSWTVLHQISSLLLKCGLTVRLISDFWTGVGASLFFAGISLSVTRILNSVALGLIVGFIVIFLELNLGEIHYPIMFFGEHTYGVITLSLTTFIFGALFAECVFFAGLATLLLMCTHPVIGIWIFSIIYILTAIYPLPNKKNLILGMYSGLFFLVLSFAYFLCQKPLFEGVVNASLLQTYLHCWDTHRNNRGGLYLNYFVPSLFGCLIIGRYSFKFNLHMSQRFAGLVLSISIILSSIIFYFYIGFFDFIPYWVHLPMPTRFSSLHSVIFLPVVGAILVRSVNDKLLQKGAKPFNLNIIFIGILIFAVGIYESKIGYRDLRMFVNSFTTRLNVQDDRNFWERLRNLPSRGFALTTISTSVETHRYGRKPILLDATGIDFVPYHPRVISAVAKIIEDAYGISFAFPANGCTSSGTIEESMHQGVWEENSYDRWLTIGREFDVSLVVVPASWKIKLKSVLTGELYSAYEIPR